MMLYLTYIMDYQFQWFQEGLIGGNENLSSIVINPEHGSIKVGNLPLS